MEYLVIDESGVFYTDPFGGEQKVFQCNSKITPKDIDLGFITEEGLASLVKSGRLKELQDGLKSENKKLRSESKKELDSEN